MFGIKGGSIGKKLTGSMVGFLTKYYECQMCKKAYRIRIRKREQKGKDSEVLGVV